MAWVQVQSFGGEGGYETVWVPDTSPIDQQAISSTDPILQADQLRAMLEKLALGLGPFDPTTEINPVDGAGCTPATLTPTAPIHLKVVGLAHQFGLAWGVQKTLANVRGYELERGLDGITFASKLGEVPGRTFIDKTDSNGQIFDLGVTRYYRIRAVIQTGSAVTYSAYSTVASATTVNIGTTNAQLQTKLDDWASSIQANSFLDDTIDKVLGVRLPQLYSFATFMGGGDRPAITDAVALVDLENRAMAFATFMGH